MLLGKGLNEASKSSGEKKGERFDLTSDRDASCKHMTFAAMSRFCGRRLDWSPVPQVTMSELLTSVGFALLEAIVLGLGPGGRSRQRPPMRRGRGRGVCAVHCLSVDSAVPRWLSVV